MTALGQNDPFLEHAMEFTGQQNRSQAGKWLEKSSRSGQLGQNDPFMSLNGSW